MSDTKYNFCSFTSHLLIYPLQKGENLKKLTCGLLTLLLWSSAANIVPTFMTSWVKCCSFGKYLRYIEWYTSRAVVCTNCVRWMMSFRRSLSLTMFTSAVCVALPGLSHFFLHCCSGESGGWSTVPVCHVVHY